MQKRLLALLTVFVLSTTLCMPVTAYGQEPDENSTAVEKFDETSDDESADEPVSSVETFDSEDERLESIITRLEEADGQVPKNFTLDDMNFFLDYADEEIIDKLLGKIESNAIPVSMDTDTSSSERSVQTRADTYMSYNCKTGEQKELKFNISDTNSNVILESEGKAVGDIMPSPYATVNAWWELNPENYYDAKVVARIYIYTTDDRVFMGSGFLIDNDVVLTAGHCLYNTNSYNGYGGWCDYIVVYPCATAKNHTPYGIKRATCTNMIAGDFYGSNKYVGNDWGAAKLSSSYSIGYLGMTTNSETEKGRSMQQEGYPSFIDEDGNPSIYSTKFYNWNLYVSPGSVTKDFSAWYKRAEAGTIPYEGMSGGPILYKNSSGRWVAGGIISGRYDGQTEYCAFDANLFNKLLDFCDS